MIRKPVSLADGQIDPELVQRALNATSEDPDQLPILQHTMMRCWERALHRAEREVDQRPHLKIEDYTEIGGVRHALSEHANEIFEKLARHPNSKRMDLRLRPNGFFRR